MSEERVQLEKNEEIITDMHGKKKKKIITIIIASVVLLIVSISLICVLKYKAEHRYIPFEELDKEQIVLIQEELRFEGSERLVYIHAINVRGDMYFLTLPYEEGVKIENYIEKIFEGERTENYLKDEEMEKIYGYITQINKDAEFYCIMNNVPAVEPTVYSQGYLYVARCKHDGNMEYIKIWEETSWCVWYLMSDSAAKQVYYSLDDFR